MSAASSMTTSALAAKHRFGLGGSTCGVSEFGGGNDDAFYDQATADSPKRQLSPARSKNVIYATPKRAYRERTHEVKQMTTPVTTNQKKATRSLERAERLYTDLGSTLAALSEQVASSDNRFQQIRYASRLLEKAKMGEALSLALDELNATPATQVGTDRVNISRGSYFAFRDWTRCKGLGPKEIVALGRATVDEFHLIDRFMKRHKGVLVSAFAKPASLQVTGTQAAREKFAHDPLLARLEQALEDIHGSDHAPGYSRPIASGPRRIASLVAYVFGE